jgi:DNA-binding winged helix-turn-helix (wHTH) protein
MVVSGVIYRFGDFRLDVAGRQLWHDERPIDLNGRYLDALVLLVRENGQLVGKERFFDEVWSGVIVSDSALTQCIKEIRRQLGDDAVRPRYVQTVPKYGYRFVGKVEVLQPVADKRNEENVIEVLPGPSAPAIVAGQGERTSFQRVIIESVAGTLGGGVAGLLGGLFYGFLITNASGSGNVGTASTMIVLLSLGIFIGMAGGFGVSCGMAVAGHFARDKKVWKILGAAAGGMFIGGVAHLLGVDAFNLLFGRTPAGITGALEGAVLGAALMIGAQIGGGFNAASPWRPVVGAGFTGAIAGVLIPLAGGKLFAGSLKLLVNIFAGSNLQIDALGRLFGDAQFGQVTPAILGGIEALLFGICVVGAIIFAQRTSLR